MRIEHIRQRLCNHGARPCHEQLLLRAWTRALPLDSGKRRPEHFLPLQLRAALPGSVEVSLLSDRTTTIRASVRDVAIELAIAIALVVMVIFGLIIFAVFARYFRLWIQSVTTGAGLEMVTVLALDQADSNPRLSRAWAFTAYCPAAVQLCDWLAAP